MNKLNKKLVKLKEEKKEEEPAINKTEIKELPDIIEFKPAQDVNSLIRTELKETGKIYEDSDGRKFKYILATGIRKDRSGNLTPYAYKKLYYIKEGKKRGPKEVVHKKQLRKLITALKEDQCKLLLDYVNNNILKANNGCETDNKEQNPIQAVL